MPRPSDVIGFVESRNGHAIAEDEGITFGPRQAELKGVTVAWMVNPESVAATVRAGHNCLVHHEALTYPYPTFTEGRERHYLSWHTNAQRLGLLAKNEIVAIRLHEGLDELCIFDAFIRQLGLGNPVAAAERGDYSHKVFASPVATFGELVAHVKKSVRMEAVRVTRERPDRPVRRIGLPWGGLGLFVNVHYVQTMIDLGADALVCGETDNYGFRFAAEAGLAVVETSHEVSEGRGLRDFAEMLRTAVGIPTAFVDLPCVWRMA